LGKEKLPAVSASASRDQNGATHISLVNIDAKQVQEVVIDIRGAKFATVTGRILTSGKLQDHNTFEKPDAVKPETFKDVSLAVNALKVMLPPFSIVVLELK
jgi:alpha-N-arabinofuranosidase